MLQCGARAGRHRDRLVWLAVAAFFGAAGLFVGTAATPAPTSACIGPVALADVAAHAATIVVGNVVWVSGRPIVPRVDFDVEVTSVLRGSPPKRIAVRDLVADYCGDHAWARLGDRVILALNVHVNGKTLNPVWASAPGGDLASIFAPAGTSFDDAIGLLSGPLPPTDAVNVERANAPPGPFLLVVVGVVLLAVSMLLLQYRRNGERSTKA